MTASFCRLLLPLAFCAALALSSCTPQASGDEPRSDFDYLVRVVYPVNGLGDGSYSDGILTGIVFSKNRIEGLEVENFSPESWSLAEAAVEDWFLDRSVFTSQRRLLILSSCEYADILNRHPQWRIPKGDAVLLLDYEGPLSQPWDQVYTRMVSCYGASYQAAGLMRILGSQKAAIVRANPVHPALSAFRDGFVEGYRRYGGSFDEAMDVYDLGQELTDGFDDQEALYRMGPSLTASGYDFVLPLCGGSILGLLSYTRETPDCFQTCGVDSNFGAYSDRVTFSIIKQMGLLVEQFIDSWVCEASMEVSRTYGLESDYVTLLIAGALWEERPSIGTELEPIIQEAVESETLYLKR